jgi:uncharacterized OB-fold protein
MEYEFEKHRIVGGIGAEDEYWRGLERGEFRIPRCGKCGHWTWPAHFRCGECGSWDFNWVTLEAKGTVFSWTRSWYVFDRTRERAADIPYVTILAEIPAAGDARIMGVLKGPDTGLHIGARVHGEIDAPSPKSKGYPSIRWVLDSVTP